MSSIEFIDDDGPLPLYPRQLNDPINAGRTSWWQEVNDYVFKGRPPFPLNYGGAIDNQIALAAACLLPQSFSLGDGVVLVSTGNLNKAFGTVIGGAGRQNTFVRVSHATNPVFSSTNSFVTYENMTMDRTGAPGASIGLFHTGVNNVTPLEGFKLRQVNVNGHGTGVILKDFVLASIEDCYIQSNGIGLGIGTTGVVASTMLHMARCWVRGNTTKGIDITSTVNAVFDQVAFETGPNGLSVSGCNNVVFRSCWWEALNLGADIVNCASVAFNSGQVDGGSLTTRCFYFQGAGTPTTIVFDGSWRTTNLGGKIFASADTGATIIIRTPDLLGLTFEAVNGGKIIWDLPLRKTRFSLTDAATVTVDASFGNYATLTGILGRTIGTPTNPSDAQELVFEFENTSAGAIIHTFSAGYRSAGTVSVAAGKIATVGFKYNSARAVWVETYRTLGL